MAEILGMQNIVKRFGAREVLKGVSLALGEGEVVSVIGPSGSGKSTLLRVAALLERAEEGGLCYLGEAAAANTPQARAMPPARRFAPARCALAWCSRASSSSRT